MFTKREVFKILTESEERQEIPENALMGLCVCRIKTESPILIQEVNFSGKEVKKNFLEKKSTWDSKTTQFTFS